MFMLTVQLDPGSEEQLQRLAEESGRTVDECASEALRQYLEDSEDVRIARERLNTPGNTYSLEEMKRKHAL